MHQPPRAEPTVPTLLTIPATSAMRRTAKVSRAGVGACALWLLVSCAPPKAATFSFLVRVESDPGAALAGAAVLRGDKSLGTTNAGGTIELTLEGAPGESVPLQVKCPPGFRSPGEPLRVVLRPSDEGAQKSEYLAACKPEVRTIVVSVRAQSGPNIPLRFLGKEIARTDTAGVAHAVLKLPPGVSANFVLDTSAPEHRALRPQNPELKITVPERDEVVLFDQPFTVEKSKQKRRGPEPAGPVRI